MEAAAEGVLQHYTHYGTARTPHVLRVSTQNNIYLIIFVAQGSESRGALPLGNIPGPFHISF